MTYLSNVERFAIDKGLQQGIDKKAHQVARKLLAKNNDLAFIAEVTDLDLKTVEKIQSDMGELQNQLS